MDPGMHMEDIPKLLGMEPKYTEILNSQDIVFYPSDIKEYKGTIEELDKRYYMNFKAKTKYIEIILLISDYTPIE